MGVTKKRIEYLTVTLLLFSLTLSGCGMRRASQGQPIEPPRVSANSAMTLPGHFAVRNTEVVINDLDVTSAGTLTVIGTAAGSLSLHEADGKLRWERSLGSAPLQTYIDPEGSFLAAGTADGKLIIYSHDQTVLLERDFDLPVALLSFSGEQGFDLFLAGLIPKDISEESKLVLLDKTGQVHWEKSYEKLLDAWLDGDDFIFVNWRENNKNILAAYDLQGEMLWQVSGNTLLAVDRNARIIISADNRDVVAYNNQGEMLWRHKTSGRVQNLLMTSGGSVIAALVAMEAPPVRQLYLLDRSGKELWQKMLPADAEVLLSPDGRMVVVASWQQYRNESTSIFVYDMSGNRINRREVAGVAQRLALAHRASLLVLGLRDGNIYFLNVEAAAEGLPDTAERSLTDYYNPVDFRRVAGEARLTLYFYDEKLENLIPVTRSIKSTTSILQASVDELIRGPIQGSYLQRTIPREEIITITAEDGVVRLDLSAGLNEKGGFAFLSGVINSLILTVSHIPTIEQVRFLVAGEEKETFGLDGIMIDRQFTASRFGRESGSHLVFLPTSSGARYYLKAESLNIPPLPDRDLLERLVWFVVRESKEYFPYNLELERVAIENSTVYLDFSDNFLNLLTNQAESAALMAALRDALALTILENTFYTNMQIRVNGQSPVLPMGYLPLEAIVSRPYYINPED